MRKIITNNDFIKNIRRNTKLLNLENVLLIEISNMKETIRIT